jgi:hypothetical protein
VSASRSGNGQYVWLDSRQERLKAVSKRLKQSEKDRKSKAFEKHIKETS